MKHNQEKQTLVIIGSAMDEGCQDMCTHATLHGFCCRVCSIQELSALDITDTCGQKFLPICVSSLSLESELFVLYTHGCRLGMELLPVGDSTEWAKITPLELPEFAEVKVYAATEEWLEPLVDNVESPPIFSEVLNGYKMINGTEVSLVSPDLTRPLVDLNVSVSKDLPATVQLKPQQSKKKIILLLMLAFLAAIGTAMLVFVFMKSCENINTTQSFFPSGGMNEKESDTLSISPSNHEKNATVESVRPATTESSSDYENKSSIDSQRVNSSLLEDMQKEKQRQAQDARILREQNRKIEEERQAAENAKQKLSERESSDVAEVTDNLVVDANGTGRQTSEREAKTASSPESAVCRDAKKQNSASEKPGHSRTQPEHKCPSRSEINNARYGSNTHKALLYGMRGGCEKCRKWVESLECQWKSEGASYKSFIPGK